MQEKKSTDTIITVPASGGQKMVKLTRDWLEYNKLRVCNNTYQSYRSTIYAFIDALPPKISPSEVTPSHIEHFLRVIIQNRKPSTANAYLKRLKIFYRWAESQSHIANVAAPIAKLRCPKPQRRIISDDEYEQILKVSRGLSHQAVQFLANTGLRRNEFRFLTWANFNGDFIFVTGKGNKSRHVPLNQICKKILGNAQVGDSPIFVKKFRPYSSLYKLCERLSRKANIPYFTPHSFRHFFATRLIKAGVPIAVISKILGHSSTEITEKIYVHLVPSDLRVTDVLNF